MSEDVPVPGAVAAAARELGLDPAADRARFAGELIRVLYSVIDKGHPAIDAIRRQVTARRGGAAAVSVPVPLSAALWSQAVFGQTVAPEHLLAAIVVDRRAALLCYGLAALDDETLEFFVRHPRVLTRLYETAAARFALGASGLRIRSNRVSPREGDAAIPLWEAAVGASVAQPDRFVPLLFGQYEGRLAYLYSVISQLEPPAARFALGLWMRDPAARAARFAALAAFTTRAFAEWRVERLPFIRPRNDLALLFLRVAVDASGAPSATRAFWSEVFGTTSGGAHEPLDAAWLAEALLPGNPPTREERLDQFAFGQRRLADAASDGRADVLLVVRSYPQQRMLMLTLERAGIRDPGVYAALARRAARFAGQRSDAAFFTQAQFQGALALVARMASVGSLAPAAAHALMTSLSAVPLDDEGRYVGQLAAWIERELLPLLPDAEGTESRLLAALAGPAAGHAARQVSWEGQAYLLDPGSAELARLRAVRGKQHSYSLDLALGMGGAARTLASTSIDVAGMSAVQEMLSHVTEAHASELVRPEPDVLAPGVARPPHAAALIERARHELDDLTASAQVHRAGALAGTLAELADAMVAETLLTLTYALAIGDPEGTALLARNVALRHDFGFGRNDAETRARAAWAVPRQQFQPGVAWHVAGSALGLDLALASLNLRRISPDRIAQAPSLSTVDREVFSVTLALMSPSRLADEHRSVIARGIEGGRRRVEALLAEPRGFDEVADAIRLDGWRRRALRWTLVHERPRVPAMFSLTELLILGDPLAREQLHGWGTSALDSLGCACTRLLPTGAWGLLAGRPHSGFLAATIPDLHLRVAIALGDLGLPSALASHVLRAAVQEFVEEVAPADAGDWWTVARTAAQLSPERIDDYVAAAAAVGGPLVPAESVEEAERK